MSSPAATKVKRNGCLAVLGGVALACGILFYGIGNRSFDPRATEAPRPTLTGQQAVDKAASGIGILAGGRKVDSVSLTGAVLSVEYRTTESEQVKFVEEWIDLFEAVGAAFAQDQSPVRRVELRVYSALGVFAGTVQADLSDIQDRRSGKISEREFIDRLVTNDA